MVDLGACVVVLYWSEVILKDVSHILYLHTRMKKKNITNTFLHNAVINNIKHYRQK